MSRKIGQFFNILTFEAYSENLLSYGGYNEDVGKDFSIYCIFYAICGVFDAAP